MGLRNCPECNGTVSSFAAICPHCGFPFVQTSDTECDWNIVAFESKTIDVSQILQMMKRNGPDDIDAEFATVDLCIEQGIPENRMEILLDVIKTKYCKVQNIIPINAKEHQMERTPRCPTCGSINIQRVGVSGRAIGGLIFGNLSVEGRAQFYCKDCGYQW